MLLADLPQRHYRAILADPPWRFKSYTALQMQNWNSRRDVEKHYPVMPIDEIEGLPVRELCHPDGCHLFLWVPGPNLPGGLRVLQAWGFKYSAIAFCWVKLRRRYRVDQLRFVPLADMDCHVGLGLTTRHNVELVLLGRRGNARRMAKDVRELILAPVREHSRKPADTHERIERYCAGPYLEMFARQRRPGWDCWGNELEKFNGDAAVSVERGDLSAGADDRALRNEELQG